MNPITRCPRQLRSRRRRGRGGPLRFLDAWFAEFSTSGPNLASDFDHDQSATVADLFGFPRRLVPRLQLTPFRSLHLQPRASCPGFFLPANPTCTSAEPSPLPPQAEHAPAPCVESRASGRRNGRGTPDPTIHRTIPMATHTHDHPHAAPPRPASSSPRAPQERSATSSSSRNSTPTRSACVGASRAAAVRLLLPPRPDREPEGLRRGLRAARHQGHRRPQELLLSQRHHRRFQGRDHGPRLRLPEPQRDHELWLRSSFAV